MKCEENPEKTDRSDWHRLWGLMMLPLFEKLGCETVVEIDLSAMLTVSVKEFILSTC